MGQGTTTAKRSGAVAMDFWLRNVCSTLTGIVVHADIMYEGSCSDQTVLDQTRFLDRIPEGSSVCLIQAAVHTLEL
eukprot:m.29109 g.29109  ORF g.29109 m.29109 type:complete len:76 (-) comp11923_c0_seq1:659-886(-)